jgi:tetratricopeptide (TPR) repeat protein
MAYFHAVEETALIRAGRLPEAQAIAVKLPLQCYHCEIARGMLANALGDVQGSEQIFAKALRDSPSLPRAPNAAGEARLGRGDLDGAIAMFKLAHARGPHYADPLEMWGEALMRKGEVAGAAAKFQEADRYAPHWGRNHLRWAQALAKQGKADDAEAQFHIAAGLALSVADRAMLPNI